MEKNVKEMLIKDFANLVSAYKDMKISDVDKTKALAILSKELKLLHETDNLELDSKIKTEKLILDKERNKAQIETDNARIKLDIDKADVQKQNDIDKINLEKEKFNRQVELDRDKFNLEEKKFNSQKRLDSRRIKIEEQRNQNHNDIELARLDIERMRLDIEQMKLIKEEELRLADLEKSKWDRISGIGIKLLEIGAPLAINALLVLMNFKLVYMDDGRVPSEMRDLMKNVYRGK